MPDICVMLKEYMTPFCRVVYAAVVCLSVCLSVRHKPVSSTTCLHIKRKAHVACNFNNLFENEKLLKVTSSRVHCKCGKLAIPRKPCQLESLLVVNNNNNNNNIHICIAPYARNFRGAVLCTAMYWPNAQCYYLVLVGGVA